MGAGFWLFGEIWDAKWRESKAPDLNGLRLKTWKHVAPGSQRLVLVGDQCQLPPTVQSTEVWLWGYGRLKRCVAGETMIIAPDIADANLIWMVCFGRESCQQDCIQIIFWGWTAIACIHYPLPSCCFLFEQLCLLVSITAMHLYMRMFSMFFTSAHLSWLFQSWSNLASLQDSPHLYRGL